MTAPNDTQTEPSAETLHLACLRLSQGPTWLWHRYYPDGIDALHYPTARKNVKALARKIGEPVCLAYQSTYLAKQLTADTDETPIIIEVFSPVAINGWPDVWLRPYIAYPQRFLSDDEIAATLLFSGAPADSPFIDFAEGKYGSDIAEVRARAAALFIQAQTEIFVTGQPGEVISGAEQAGKIIPASDRAKTKALQAIRKFRGLEQADVAP